jgi:FkbM family methyltransferase
MNIYPLFSVRKDSGQNKVCKILTMESGVAFDIGANNGGFVYDFINRFEEVHAFEPVQDQFDLLSKINSPKLIANRVAISSKPGKLENVNVFNTWSLLPNTCLTVDKAIDYSQKESFSVDVITLDDYCKSNSVLPDYIKLDVDGYEPFALEGAIDTLNKTKCPIYMEYSYLPERFFNYPKEKFVKFIYDLGYQAHSIDGMYCAENPEKMLECYPHHTSYDVMLVHVDY